VVLEDSSRRRRVLVADNNVDLARVLGEIIGMDDSLEFVGYVTTGAEALEKTRASTTDILILDLGLEDCHGFEVLDRLRADASEVRVIIHTGHASRELAANAMRKGAAAYVVKDGDPDALLAAIHRA
jgi:DNA-binding NarL/FixJ family response regulator